MQECARVILQSPASRVLLMKTKTWEGELWVTPGGRMNAGEETRAAAAREMYEETGLSGIALGTELWIREWSFTRHDGQVVPQREHFFQVLCGEFNPTESGMGREERDVHVEFRWWAMREIATSTERFEPPQLASLLRKLQKNGPPTTPWRIVG